MKSNLNSTAKIIALISFVIGTCLFSLYLYYGIFFIPILLTLGFLVLAIIINLIMLTVILGTLFINKASKSEGLKTCGIILLNIPIAMLYYYLIMAFPRNDFLF